MKKFLQHLRKLNKKLGDEINDFNRTYRPNYISDEEFNDHDCHLSPDDGCKICEQKAIQDAEVALNR